MNTSTGFDLLQNLDTLKESLRLAGTGTYNWQDIDISQFQGKLGMYNTCCVCNRASNGRSFVHSCPSNTIIKNK